MLKKLGLITVAFIITSCATHSNVALDGGDDKKIAQMITKEKTTKEEIVATFGKPETMAKDKEGRDVWIYLDDKTSLNPLNIIPVTRVLLGATGTEKKLVITFDRSIVYDYVFTTQAIRTKKGLLTMGESKN